MLPHIHRYSLCREHIYLCRILRNPYNSGPRTTNGTLKLYFVRLSAVNTNIERKHRCSSRRSASGSCYWRLLGHVYKKWNTDWMPYVAERHTHTQTRELHWSGRHEKVLRIRQFFFNTRHKDWPCVIALCWCHTGYCRMPDTCRSFWESHVECNFTHVKLLLTSPVHSTTNFGNTTPYWVLIRAPQHYHTDFVITGNSLCSVLSKLDQTDTTQRVSRQKNVDFTSVS